MIRDKILLCGLVLISSHLFSQKTYTYNGSTINLDDIPIGRSLDKPIDGSKSIVEGKNIIYEKIFASDNKRFLAISETYKTTDSKNIKTEGGLKIFSTSGSLLWETKQDNLTVSECIIDPDGDYFHVNWHSIGEDVNKILITYDKKGKQINKIDNLLFLYCGDKKDKIFYINDFGITGRNEDKFKLFFNDFSTGMKWEKLFPSTKPIFIMNVSKNGKNAVISSDKVYFINSLGDILWEKNQYESPGFVNISADSEMVLWVPKTGKMFLFDKTGNEKWEKGTITVENNNYTVYRACFVSNNKNIIVTSNILSNENRIAFIDVNGNIIDKVSFKDIMFGNEKNIIWGQMSVEQNKSKFTIYYNGFKTYEYNANWK